MFSVLTSKIYGALVIALAFAFFVTVLGKNGEIRGLTKANDALQSKLTLCNNDRNTLLANQGKLEASLARQNASIADMQAAAANKAAKAASDRQKALQQAANAAAKARELGKRVAGADACASANEIILESIQ